MTVLDLLFKVGKDAPYNIWSFRNEENNNNLIIDKFLKNDLDLLSKDNYKFLVGVRYKICPLGKVYTVCKNKGFNFIN